jgi:hypothetical protein
VKTFTVSQGPILIYNLHSLCNLVVVSVQNLLQSAEHKIHSIEHATGGDFPLFLTALTLTSTMMYKLFNKI